MLLPSDGTVEDDERVRKEEEMLRKLSDGTIAGNEGARLEVEEMARQLRLKSYRRDLPGETLEAAGIVFMGLCRAAPILFLLGWFFI